MPHRLRSASLHVVEGHSVVAPLIIDGLPAEIDALGTHWHRKREFHLTVVPASMLEAAGGGRDPSQLWDLPTSVLSGRIVGPITTGDDVRRVTRADDDDLQTLIVMVNALGMNALYRELSNALETELVPPPAHVTLYSTDPAQGIGIEDEAQLAERAPQLAPAAQREVREAMSFDTVFVDDANGDAPFTPEFIVALEYASSVHRGQRHRGRNVPYLAHLLSVAALVAEDGGDEIEAIAALLHDAAEDHGGEHRLSDIDQRFGPDVATVVRALSDSLETDPSPQESWRVRKERYLAALQHETDPRVLRVSNADKLHNVRTLLAERRLQGEKLWQGHPRDKQEELWYYGALAEIFSKRRPRTSMLVRELAETVALLTAG